MEKQTNCTAEQEKQHPRHVPEVRILNEPYRFNTSGYVGDMETHQCLNTPVSAQQYEKNAMKGYCPIHRHPAHVDFIEAMTSILAKAYGKIMEEIDMDAVKEIRHTAMKRNFLQSCDRGLIKGDTMEYGFFETHFIYPAELILTGWATNCDGCHPDGSQILERCYRFCKGRGTSNESV